MRKAQEDMMGRRGPQMSDQQYESAKREGSEAPVGAEFSREGQRQSSSGIAGDLARAAGLSTTTSREDVGREGERREGYTSTFGGAEQQQYREASSLGGEGATGYNYSYEGGRAPEAARIGEESRFGGERFMEGAREGEGYRAGEGVASNITEGARSAATGGYER